LRVEENRRFRAQGPCECRTTPETIRMQSNDRELIYQLLEDASTLRGLVDENRRPTPQAARAIIAPILRRWIWEQTFSFVQKLLRPHVVKFPLFPMKAMIELCERGIVEHWMSMISVQGLAVSTALPRAAYIKTDGTSPLSQGRQDDLAQTLHTSRQFSIKKCSIGRTSSSRARKF